MRYLITVLSAAWLATSALNAQWIRPFYPSITFSDSSDKPVISGSPTVIDTVMLNYSSPNGANITSAEIRGDSLVFETSLIDSGPVDSGAVIIVPLGKGYKIFFGLTGAGVYKAYERQSPVCVPQPCPPFLSYRGTFHILPIINTTPFYLTVRDSIKMQLILGLGDCWYSSSYRIADSLIYLSYFRTACGDTLFPEGPAFNLGILPAGNYQLMMEDSVHAGSITVHDVIVVNGSVRPMTSPLSSYMPPPVRGAEILAVLSPRCGEWNSNPAIMDTLRTTSDTTGTFTLTLPNSGEDYRITALASGYYAQTMYLKGYPVQETQPPRVNLDYELLQDSDTALANCEILVKDTRGAPVESAYVVISGGKDACLIYKAMAKAAAGYTHFGGYTDKQGRIAFSDVSLDPFIDYTAGAGKNVQGETYRMIRLNRFMDMSFTFILGGASGELPGLARPAGLLDISPNPFYPMVTVRFTNPDRKADITIYGIDGKQVKSFRNVSGESVAWNAQGLPAGVYVLKARVDGRTLTRKMIFAK